MTKHKIIFEGAELSGKSWLMSQVYNFLEPKYNSGGKILDGCHWFNCDVGLFGTQYGQVALEKYLQLVEAMPEANLMLEKFHLSEAVYQKMYHQKDFDFSLLEGRLKKLDSKLILVTFPEDEALLAARIEDRLRLWPHYAKILQKPEDYIKQQQVFLEFLAKSKLEHLIIQTNQLPDDNLVSEILNFLKEK